MVTLRKRLTPLWQLVKMHTGRRQDRLPCSRIRSSGTGTRTIPRESCSPSPWPIPNPLVLPISEQSWQFCQWILTRIATVWTVQRSSLPWDCLTLPVQVSAWWWKKWHTKVLCSVMNTRSAIVASFLISDCYHFASGKYFPAGFKDNLVIMGGGNSSP